MLDASCLYLFNLLLTHNTRTAFRRKLCAGSVSHLGECATKTRILGPAAPISKAKAQEEEAGLIAAGRQSLRLKVGYDEEKIDRLIEYERQKLGNLPLHVLMASAGERWERDNR